jgi:4-hydroxy-3-polyprenylbenzoate decarboxylase
LLDVNAPLSHYLEVTELHKRSLQNSGPALRINQPTKADGTISQIPMLVNLFGHQQRILWALGLENVEELKELGRTLAFLKQPEPPKGIKNAMQMLPLLKKVMAMKPKSVTSPACQQHIYKDGALLDKLPIQTCWPDEPAPLMTWPLVITTGKSANTKTNIGIYRMQKLSNTKAIMRWLAHRGGALHFREWQQHASNEERQRGMPVAVVLGAPPAITIAGVTPIPDNISEYQYAGLLQDSRVQLADCLTVPLQVPAQAEIIIEGHISFTDTAPEGPFGDHTGYYNSVEEFPVFTVSCVTTQDKPIYLSTYTGRPPDECSVLGETLNHLFVPLLQQQFPEVADFYLPPEACSYRIGVIVLKKKYAGHARQIMMGCWSFLRQFMYTKAMIVVDEDINPRNWHDVMWALSTRVDPKRDFMMLENTPIDYLDFASPIEGLGSKVGIDATNKFMGETMRDWGKAMVMDQQVITKIDQLYNELAIKPL